uniref:Uncharacterized protein n=1 Tax=Cajanus cajan TaxID=3821 RepID=A0A151U2C2_CAJCA|nr:hypothetical protein KK1_006108 [Cajanus cajan]
MVAKIRQSVVNSPNPTKPVVGEIDTSPPIQSVKDAVSLFAEGALSGEKPVIKKAKSYFAESVWAKESQLHLAQKELTKLKEQLKNAETTKAQVEVELEKAKRVVEELTQKLKVLGESRESAVQATEDSNSQAKKLKEEKCELTKNLEVQLSETMNEIGSLQEQMENTKKSDLDSLKSVTVGLDDAKELLLKLSGQENSVRSTVEALRMELENVQREHYELKEKESKTESIVESLRLELQKSEAEIEANLAKESKAREIKLKEALEEAEEAKAAEASALDQIRVLSASTSDAAHSSTSESGAKITISREEFESLVHKAEECDKLADIKVAAATAQVEAAKASENEVLKRLEETQKEIEDIKTETQEAMKRANMADAARRAVESELRKWREREQKKAAEVASQILAETRMSPELSPQHYRIQKQNSPPNKVEMKKLEKGKVSVSKKVLLPNISGIFHRKKNQVEGGSPSYLPGENPQ